jgi:hypothetical protein
MDVDAWVACAGTKDLMAMLYDYFKPSLFASAAPTTAVKRA